MTDTLVAGMNRYRAWIDRRGWHVLVASQLLSLMVMGTLIVVVQAVFTGMTGPFAPPVWAVLAAVAAIHVEVYLGAAQMTRWRSGVSP